MRPAGSPAKAKETGGFRPAPEGQQKAIPTVILHGRWYEAAGPCEPFAASEPPRVNSPGGGPLRVGMEARTALPRCRLHGRLARGPGAEQPCARADAEPREVRPVGVPAAADRRLRAGSAMLVPRTGLRLPERPGRLLRPAPHRRRGPLAVAEIALLIMAPAIVEQGEGLDDPWLGAGRQRRQRQRVGAHAQPMRRPVQAGQVQPIAAQHAGGQMDPIHPRRRGAPPRARYPPTPKNRSTQLCAGRGGGASAMVRSGEGSCAGSQQSTAPRLRVHSAGGGVASTGGRQ